MIHKMTHECCNSNLPFWEACQCYLYPTYVKNVLKMELIYNLFSQDHPQYAFNYGVIYFMKFNSCMILKSH